jgi:hypothetical protein
MDMQAHDKRPLQLAEMRFIKSNDLQVSTAFCSRLAVPKIVPTWLLKAEAQKRGLPHNDFYYLSY